MKKLFSVSVFIYFILFSVLAQNTDLINDVNSRAEFMGNPFKAPLLRTKTGLILYNDAAYDGYTVRVDSIVSVTFPKIELYNSNILVHSWLRDNKLMEKGNAAEDVLKEYMHEEWRYIIRHKRYGHKIKRTQEYISAIIDSTVQNIDSLNFWYYNILTFKEEEPPEIRSVFYMDGYFNDYLLRFTYHSKSGLVDEAEKDLIKLFRNVKFYSGDIDIDKLEAEIELGNYFYEEPFE